MRILPRLFRTETRTKLGKWSTRDLLLGGVLFLSALGIAWEFFLRLGGGPGLCATDACAAVGRYLHLGEQWLILGGAVFFLLLLVLFLWARSSERPLLWGLFAVLLTGGLAFDGGLLGYQFLELGLVCVICLGVAAGLFVTLASASWRRASWLLLFTGLAVWAGGFAANSVLLLTPDMPKLEETSFLEQKGESKGGSRYYLFFSLECGHCSVVLYNLARSSPLEGKWHLSSLDGRPESQARLAMALEDKTAGNIFLRVLKAKQAQEAHKSRVPENVTRSVNRAKAYFRARGFQGVPLLVVREDSGIRISLTGVENIARYLWEEGVVQEWVRPETKGE